MVTCEQCGRQIRRDKAVFIEKPVFNNPLDRSEVVDEYYTRTLMREFAYCPSCGKHFRIYQKKKQMQERQREKARNAQFRGGGFGTGPRRGPQRYRTDTSYGQKTPAPTTPAPASPTASAESSASVEQPVVQTEESQSA